MDLQPARKEKVRFIFYTFLPFALFLWLSHYISSGGLTYDHPINFWIYYHPLPHRVHQLIYLITTLANVETVLALLGTFWLLSIGFRKYRKETASLTLMVVLSALIEGLLKPFFKRFRPFGAPLVSSYGFPSGHALLSVCFYGLICYLLGTRFFPKHQKLFLMLGIVLSILIGTSRVFLGWHYASDILGGYLIALPLLMLGIWLVDINWVCKK